jgi:NTP pyrophosphatase (non-canonical NTP hydrolase)
VGEDAKTMAEVREELADITAYLLSFASKMGIDVSSALEEKMRKNAAKYPADRFRGRFK